MTPKRKRNIKLLLAFIAFSILYMAMCMMIFHPLRADRLPDLDGDERRWFTKQMQHHGIGSCERTGYYTGYFTRHGRRIKI
jgi:hypothetical protein